jgi:hypothetical protein
MVATGIAAIALVVSCMALVISWQAKHSRPLSLGDIRRSLPQMLKPQQPSIPAPAETPVPQQPFRKRPGIGTLRHQKELESMQPLERQAEITRRNTRAMQS